MRIVLVPLFRQKRTQIVPFWHKRHAARNRVRPASLDVISEKLFGAVDLLQKRTQLGYALVVFLRCASGRLRRGLNGLNFAKTIDLINAAFRQAHRLRFLSRNCSEGRRSRRPFRCCCRTRICVCRYCGCCVSPTFARRCIAKHADGLARLRRRGNGRRLLCGCAANDRVRLPSLHYCFLRDVPSGATYAAPEGSIAYSSSLVIGTAKPLLVANRIAPCRPRV